MTNFNNLNIMNAEGATLTNMIGSYLSTLDDYMQLASDNNDDKMAEEFSKAYNFLEIYYSKAKQELLSIQERNEVRVTMKHSYKNALQFIC